METMFSAREKDIQEESSAVGEHHVLVMEGCNGCYL